MEREAQMKNPRYYRRMSKGRFMGLKCVIVEYLDGGMDKWQLDSEFIADEEIELSSVPGGVALTKRALLKERTRD